MLISKNPDKVCIVYSTLLSVAWQPNFGKKISSQERGGGVRGVEQWFRMATDYKIVVVPDTGSPDHGCIELSGTTTTICCQMGMRCIVESHFPTV